MIFFHTELSSPLIIVLIIIYFITESVSTFDTRIIQAKKDGYLSPDSIQVPAWTGVFAILGWLIFLAIFLLNYKIAIFIFVLKFILKVIPVLENVGAVFMIPIVGTEKAFLVNAKSREQASANKEMKKMNSE